MDSKHIIDTFTQIKHDMETLGYKDVFVYMGLYAKDNDPSLYVSYESNGVKISKYFQSVYGSVEDSIRQMQQYVTALRPAKELAQENLMTKLGKLAEQAKEFEMGDIYYQLIKETMMRISSNILPKQPITTIEPSEDGLWQKMKDASGSDESFIIIIDNLPPESELKSNPGHDPDLTDEIPF